MKIKLAIASLLAFLVIGVSSVPTADAFVWHMSYGQAKKATKEFAKEACAQDGKCLGWGTGQCYRKSQSHFACAMGLFFAGAELGEEVECDMVLHWGVSASGYMVLKRHGPPHCSPA